MELNAAFVGFGNVARAFARMLHDNRNALDARFGLRLKTTAIATARHGCLLSSRGIDLIEAVAFVERNSDLTDLGTFSAATSPLELIDNCKADILFETTPLSVCDGEPATTYIRRALSRGLHVVTANKGPIAFAYSPLKTLARDRGVHFRFEGTVMDGAPVFNLVERCLPGVTIRGFCGVLNSTTNLVLTGMESGLEFAESLNDAKKRGIAEANSDYDIDGWDAAVKATALANVFFGSDVRPHDVERVGIRELTLEDVREACRTKEVWRLIARGTRTDRGVMLKVNPERVPTDSALGSVRGTSNVLVLYTDLMGDISIVENDPGVQQTAYALLSDLVSIHQCLCTKKH